MFGRAITALVTPFSAEGKIDFDALGRSIQWHLETGTEGLVLCGSTGEGTSLSHEEKIAVFELGYRLAKGKMALIANTGTNLTEESVWLTQKAKVIGMDGALAIVPYYNKPTAEGCFRHFEKIAEVGLPMIVYHHPGRTGTKLSFETLCRICALDTVVGIKDATGDLGLAMDLIHKGGIRLYSGDDSLALAQFSIGFTGSISITGNVVPSAWNDFVQAAVLGDFLEAKEQFYRLYDLVNALVLEVNPQCVKYAASLLGRGPSRLRLPLLEPSELNCEKIRKVLRAFSESIPTHQ